MRIITNKIDSTKAILLAETEDDKVVLESFFKNHIIFGLYKIWLRSENCKGENRPEVTPFLNKIPTLQGVGWLNVVRGFVPTKIIT